MTGESYSFHAANASPNARSPGAPFSMAMMARRWLAYTRGHVEPGALLQELDVAGAVGVDIRQPDQEEAVGDLDREACQRRAARLLVGFHQNAGHVGDAAIGEILRQDEGQLRGVAGGQRGVGIAAERYRHLELALGMSSGKNIQFLERRRRALMPYEPLSLPTRLELVNHKLRTSIQLAGEYSPIGYSGCEPLRYWKIFAWSI
jgi:hypothetical protein